MSKNILVTIAARGGSKGIRNKNIRLLKGKPLIYYTIKQALAWKKADYVVVSTDSLEIADVAKKYGADVPFIRPKKLATDRAGKVGAIRHALKQSEDHYGKKFNIVVDLDVTSPVRSLKDLDRCLELFNKHRPKTLFSVVESHKNPYFNMFEVDRHGRVKPCKKSNGKIKRRQDAPKVFDANASIYFYDRNYLLNSKDPSPVNNRCINYLMPSISGCDIDREIDFKFLEFLVNEKVVSL